MRSLSDRQSAAYISCWPCSSQDSFSEMPICILNANATGLMCSSVSSLQGFSWLLWDDSSRLSKAKSMELVNVHEIFHQNKQGTPLFLVQFQSNIGRRDLREPCHCALVIGSSHAQLKPSSGEDNRNSDPVSSWLSLCFVDPSEVKWSTWQQFFKITLQNTMQN